MRMLAVLDYWVSQARPLRDTIYVVITGADEFNVVKCSERQGDAMIDEVGS